VLEAGTFRREDHSYWVGSSELISVTTVLRRTGLISGAEYFTERARRRGEASHLACWYDDQGDLDETTLSPSVRPRLEAWRKFRAATAHWQQVAIEEPMFSTDLGVAGTPDRIYRSGSQLFIPDIKTAALEAPWWNLQSAGYGLLAERAYGVSRASIRRFSVRLLEDGNFRLAEHRNRADYERFRAALLVAQLQKEFGSAIED